MQETCLLGRSCAGCGRNGDGGVGGALGSWTRAAAAPPFWIHPARAMTGHRGQSHMDCRRDRKGPGVPRPPRGRRWRGLYQLYAGASLDITVRSPSPPGYDPLPMIRKERARRRLRWPRRCEHNESQVGAGRCDMAGQHQALHGVHVQHVAEDAWAYVGRNLVRDEWFHIACSYDGTTLTSYLDGEQAEQTPMGPLPAATARFSSAPMAGAATGSPRIDDVRIYNHGLTPG